MKKIFLLLSLTALLFLSKTAVCQAVTDTPIVHNLDPTFYKTSLLTGRVIGVNLENVQGVSITNIRTSEKASTDSRGIYQVNAAKGDTLAFYIAKYSKDTLIVGSIKENLNLIMIKRKVDELPANHSESDFNRARRADNELYRVLEKDAKLEGKWKY